jgi:folylpolyglutamate synthase/dihydropteroate synthase
MLGDKDARALIRALSGRVVGVVVATPSSPRALAASKLADVWRAVSDRPVDVALSVAAALEQASALAGPDGGVVVAGSFVTASEARAALGLADVLTYQDHLSRLDRIGRAVS